MQDMQVIQPLYKYVSSSDRCAIAKYRVVKAENIDSDPENSEVVTLDDDYEVNDQD